MVQLYMFSLYLRQQQLKLPLKAMISEFCHIRALE